MLPLLRSTCFAVSVMGGPLFVPSFGSGPHTSPPPCSFPPNFCCLLCFYVWGSHLTPKFPHSLLISLSCLFIQGRDLDSGLRNSVPHLASAAKTVFILSPRWPRRPILCCSRGHLFCLPFFWIWKRHVWGWYLFLLFCFGNQVGRLVEESQENPENAKF